MAIYSEAVSFQMLDASSHVYETNWNEFELPLLIKKKNTDSDFSVISGQQFLVHNESFLKNNHSLKLYCFAG